jgi:hypothetical protein
MPPASAPDLAGDVLETSGIRLQALGKEIGS